MNDIYYIFFQVILYILPSSQSVSCSTGGETKFNLQIHIEYIVQHTSGSFNDMKRTTVLPLLLWKFTA